MGARRKTALAGAASLVLLLSACGPSSGWVIDKSYDDADWYMTTCFRTESTVVNGQATTRQVPYPCQQYDPAHYDLFLREDDDGAGSEKPEEGWRSVNEQVYMACEIGQFYSEEGVCQ